MKVECLFGQLWVDKLMCAQPYIDSDKDGKRIIIQKINFNPEEVFEKE